jgi:hypothetical protein
LRPNLLLAPRAGSRIRRPPVFRWVAARRALYYNLQLFRNGHKVLSAWPGRNRYVLGRSWVYKKHRYSLLPGAYTWFVWPGVGPRAAARYGPLIGRSSFIVLPA